MRASVDPSLLGRVAQRIWAEGLSNPLDWTVRTEVGSFATADRCTWRSADGAWTVELRRSRNRRHLYLALFHAGTYQGRYDSNGWRAASGRSRVRHLRSPQLALRLVA
jgi:hypothetical protein